METNSNQFPHDALNQKENTSEIAEPTMHGYSLLRKLALGKPIASDQVEHTLISKIIALPVFASDAISSTAYATQEILLVLGAAGLWLIPQDLGYYTLLISGLIVLLLGIVVTSYWQTIFAYPNGGGSYIVSKDNLGTNLGLIAAAALLIDYVLTVSVSIAAGIQNLASIPFLDRNIHPQQHMVALSVLAIFFLTFANLRGLKESGKVFALPTYVFVAMCLLMIGLGAIGPWFGWSPNLSDITEVTSKIPQSKEQAHAAFGLFGIAILLKAFASGCAAMTGTEAVSNGIPAFTEPKCKNAAITLLWMGIILATLFFGISWLAARLHVVYYDGAPAVIDQISGAIFGKSGFGSVFYLLTQIFTALVLVLAANTCFADFPRLASILARDGFMPKQLTHLGDKLVFSNGILVLGLSAAFVLYLKNGMVDALIPLYATGVFTAFTLSQSGMVIHWYKTREKRWLRKAAINGIGAIATTLVLATIVVEKFVEGAWIIVLLIGVIVFILRNIRTHYVKIGKKLAVRGMPLPDHDSAHSVLIIVSGLHKGIIPALNYARSIGSDVRAIYVDSEPNGNNELSRDWSQKILDVPLVVIPSPYRSVVRPFMKYLDQLKSDQRIGLVTVVIPEFVPPKWWQNFLHGQIGLRLKLALLSRKDGTVVTNIRYHL